MNEWVARKEPILSYKFRSGRGQPLVCARVRGERLSLYLSNSNPPPHLLQSAATQTECISARAFSLLPR